jgi:hypothetical protein
MKIKLLACLFSTLLVANGVYAINLPKTIDCPSVSNIVSEGIDYVAEFPFGQNTWGAYKLKSKYNTNDDWSFYMIFPAADQNDAFTKAISLMKGLSPEGIQSEDGRTLCYYRNQEQVAVATNPPDNYD